MFLVVLWFEDHCKIILQTCFFLLKYDFFPLVCEGFAARNVMWLFDIPCSVTFWLSRSCNPLTFCVAGCPDNAGAAADRPADLHAASRTEAEHHHPQGPDCQECPIGRPSSVGKVAAILQLAFWWRNSVSPKHVKTSMKCPKTSFCTPLMTVKLISVVISAC